MMACPAYLREFDTDVPDPEIRVRGNSINARILERLLRHRHFLLMAENGLVSDLVGPLREVKAAVTDRLSELARQADLDTLEQAERRQFRRLQRALGSTIREARDAQLTRASRRFRQLADREIEIQNRILEDVLPREVHPFVNFAGPDVLRVQTILDQPLGGKRWAERLRETFGDLTIQMRNDLATSLALGESMPEAARRLRSTVDRLGMRRSTLLARTEIQRIANESAQRLYEANSQVIKAVQWVATLDDRTCLICAPLDGETWPLNSSHPRPVGSTHPACRCYLSPVTRSFREMGIDAPEFGPTSRASMDGQVPAQVDYGEWFGRQDKSFQRRVLGERRFELFDSGELDLDGFSRSQRVLSLDELPEAGG